MGNNEIKEALHDLLRKLMWLRLTATITEGLEERLGVAADALDLVEKTCHEILGEE